MNKKPLQELAIDGKWVYTCSFCILKLEHTTQFPLPYWHDCKGPPKLGDRVEQFLRWLGFKRKCKGCQRRKETLNRWSEIYAKFDMGLRSYYRRAKNKGWFTTKDSIKSSQSKL